ncbi:hypothetical protein [Oryzifoliimicrobium ureilyticus]|uniref:hypothetical protein n=1 Tax=Oryzifoliimicrobium ureilyticus TaxID=3113724 RepID=UPI00307666E6
MTATKEEFFKPAKVSPQQKATTTDQAARQIIASEAAERLKKTERLRLLREAKEAEAPVAAPARKKKTAVKA